MSDPVSTSDIAAMSFEDALAELEQIVRRLEAGQVKLDEAIQCYERGAQLKSHCEQKLNEAQQRVDRIVIEPNGTVGSEPLNLGQGSFRQRRPGERNAVAEFGFGRRSRGDHGATDRWRAGGAAPGAAGRSG